MSLNFQQNEGLSIPGLFLVVATLHFWFTSFKMTAGLKIAFLRIATATQKVLLRMNEFFYQRKLSPGLLLKAFLADMAIQSGCNKFNQGGKIYRPVKGASLFSSSYLYL